MKRLQLHIGLFFLLLFVFPQANNALHYFVVKHHFHQYNANEKQFQHKHKTHDCEQSIFKIPNTLLFDFGYTKPKKFIPFLEIEVPFILIIYKKILFKNLSDRGPP